MKTSVFHLHSMGRVAENIELGSKVVRVYFTEDRIGEDEEVIANPQREEVTYQTSEGERKAAATTDTSFPCTWLKRNSNRVTPPNVRRDDEVIVWRMGDSDNYYWEDTGNANVKRLETVIWAYSADPNGPINGDLTNAYVVEMSTHQGLFAIHTSTANGEPFAWDFQIDAKGGRASVESSGGEHVLIDSNEELVELMNASDSVAQLKGPDAFVNVKNNIHFTAENDQEFVCKRFIVRASEKILFESPEVECTEELKVGGNVDVTGGIESGGDMKGGGGAEFTKPVKAPSFDGPCNKAH